ncbi:hypothetical protein SAMN04488023_10190 [Pedobacter rhizosphaerae]|uniref:Uncharacterized protein n=1 Tax=Pedobacter rhizosphaerae TaxID=390241 RepID=A0A1H9IU69_9SPHI|nr:hypothetical protein SAMN04488023_10190 [Pedobacter rhizosphaerae]
MNGLTRTIAASSIFYLLYYLDFTPDTRFKTFATFCG